MRITNGIMVNNSLYNINKNKELADKINAQIYTTKKIQRPSEDPIVAMRALRLRTTLNEINQYVDKNIPDAESWMTSTKDAMSSISDVISQIKYYVNQGVSTYNTIDERNAVITSLKEYRNALYQDGNADNAGRTVFTGYKTNDSLTFTKAEPETVYTIKENFSFDDVNRVNRVVGVKQTDINNLTAPNAVSNIYVGTDISNNTLNIVKMAYKDIDLSSAINIESSNTNINGATVTVKSFDTLGDSVYNVSDNEIVFVAETGELIFGQEIYKKMNGSEFSVTYTKTGFDEGDLKPEHYFDCEKTVQTGTDSNGIAVYDTKTYTSKDQTIDYTIGFNQTITINTQAKDILTHSLGRDIDEMIESLEAAIRAQEKIDSINKKLAITTNTADVTKLDALLEVAKLELTYAEGNMKTSFSEAITKYSNHQNKISEEMSSLGARMSRLDLVKDRLEQQRLSVEELKSKNEDTDLTTAAVQFKTASDVYDASLAAAAKIVQQTLLDFI